MTDGSLWFALMNFRKIIRTAALISIGSLLWTTSPNCLAQTKASKIAALMSSLSERGQFSGSILVAEHGRMIYERGFAVADIKHNVAFTPNTPVYLASLTKQFTAMAIMMLAERRQLSYSDPLSKDRKSVV